MVRCEMFNFYNVACVSLVVESIESRAIHIAYGQVEMGMERMGTVCEK